MAAEVLVEVAVASAVGWAAWAVTITGIAVGDVVLSRLKHTTLSDTWLQGAHNQIIRPAEVATYAALGAHLFFGTSLIPVFAGIAALGVAVGLSFRKRP